MMKSGQALFCASSLNYILHLFRYFFILHTYIRYDIGMVFLRTYIRYDHMFFI